MNQAPLDIKIQYDMLQIILRGKYSESTQILIIIILIPFFPFIILQCSSYVTQNANSTSNSSLHLTFHPEIHPQIKATWINVSKYQHLQPSCIFCILVDVHCSPHYYNNLLCCIYVLYVPFPFIQFPFLFLFIHKICVQEFFLSSYKNNTFFKYAEPKESEQHLRKKSHELLM